MNVHLYHYNNGRERGEREGGERVRERERGREGGERVTLHHEGSKPLCCLIVNQNSIVSNVVTQLQCVQIAGEGGGGGLVHYVKQNSGG